VDRREDAVESAIRRGEGLLRETRILDAQDAFYEAVYASGRDPEVKLRIADAWRKRGWVSTMNEDDPESGWTMFHNARAIYKSLNGQGFDRLWEVERGMAIAEGKMGGHEQALLLCDDAARHAPGRRERCKVLNTRSISLNSLGREEEALECAYWVLRHATDEETLRVARQSLGVILLRTGRPAKALKYLENGVLRAWAHVEAGDHREALKADPGDRPRGYLIRARAWLGLGKTERAIAELRRGASIVEASRSKLDTEAARAAFQGARQEIYALLVRLCAEKGRWADAFAHAEEGRARSFLDFVVAGGRRDLSHLRRSERGRFERLRGRIEALQAKGARTPQEGGLLGRLEAEYGMSLRRYEKERLAGAGIQPARPLGALEVGRSLGKGEALVEYQVADGAILAFFFSGGRFQPFRLGVDVEDVLGLSQGLAGTIRVARRDERAGGRAFFEWNFGRLGKALLGGLPLEGVERLVVVPHGELHRVPFPALRLGGRYLVERCAVSLAPSASVHVALSRKARRAPVGRGCLLVKDPTGTLRHVDAEEEALRERFGRGLAVLEGETASRDRVLGAAPGRGYLHFSTHAVYRPERPEFSRLDLGGGEKLYASDVLGLDLSGCRGVALSACDSGRGDYSGAEELFGLPRAFLRAGACSVLATLWPVEDHPGIGSFMREYYGFLGSGRDPASALRAAQRFSLASSLPATLWASFVMIGA
jgi:tetratricopeptide (TPR) repeat protein